ncbi:MAG: Bug family tripartite tricarboxylate transporter substrate binding protein [Burkholderiales bacterium]
MHRFIVTSAALIAAIASVACGVAQAQSYPVKPVQLIAPFPPGGAIDVLARNIGQKFQQRNGHAVVVENRAGAAGNIGIEMVAKSAPDGYTWLFVPQGNITINATLMPNMPFNWDRDFTPVTLIAYAANVLAVHPSVPARSTQELIAYARANPGKLSYGSPGIGSSLHLIGELINREAGVDMVHVPYKGTVPAMQDLLGGQISMMFGAEPTLMPQVKAGKLRALAVTSAKRSPTAPDLPSMVEGGLKNIDVPSWYGAMVAARTPRDIVGRIHSEIAAIVNLPEVRATLQGQGLQPLANNPDDFAAQIKRETALWARVIKEAGIKAQ